MAALDFQVTAAYDPDDMFGLRRALAVLPERRHDEFFDRWTALSEQCGYELHRLRGAVADEAGILRTRPDRTGRELGAAWSVVADAMAGYLDWRAGR